MFLIKHFVASTIHLGQKTNLLNPRTCFFLLGFRDGIFIIDLEQSLLMFSRAFSLLRSLVLRRGFIFFAMSTLSSLHGFPLSPLQKKLLVHSDFYFSHFNLILLSSDSSSKQRGLLSSFSLKRFSCFWDHSSRSLPVLKPELLFVLHVPSHLPLIKQAFKLQIPIIGILDSSSNPYGISYPIPGNSDSLLAFNFYTEFLLHSLLSSKTNVSHSFLS